MISTRQVYDYILSLDHSWSKVEKLVQELAWRDYYQQVWIAKGDDIHTDLKHEQKEVRHHKMPKAVLDAQTGIEAVDEALEKFYATGYMHNHMRMYVASICCNLAGAHWWTPSQWLFYHLWDGDQASNQLNWQWVAGSFSNKKYYANQNNINKYFHSSQNDTFLDTSYEKLKEMDVPEVLKEAVEPDLSTSLPERQIPDLDGEKETLIYNYYNLDPKWHEDENVQRVLLLEPDFFKDNPVSQKCMDFILGLAENIEDIKTFVGSFDELKDKVEPQHLIYKEHPTNRHYEGQEEDRDWMSSVTGYFPSFFKFWNKCKKELKP